MTKAEERRQQAQIRMAEREARRNRENKLLGVLGRYINHGRWGWYLEPAGKLLAHAENPLQALAAEILREVQP